MTTHKINVSPAAFHAIIHGYRRALYLPNYDVIRVADILQIFLVEQLEDLYVQARVIDVETELAYCEDNYCVASFELGLELK